MTALIINSLNLNILRKFAKHGYKIISNTNENLFKILQNDYQQNQIMSISNNLKNQINI